MKIEMKPIGIVHTDAVELPRHYTVSDVRGTIEIEKQYLSGLRDIHPGEKIVVLFHFHKSPAFTSEYLLQTPPHKNIQKGVFSICSPKRPNPLGMSILEVIAIKSNIIEVAGLDMLDGTPILDLKPFVAET